MNSLLSDHQYFCLYKTCIPVKGAVRSVICDLERNRLDFIPNSLYEILVDYKDKSLGELRTDFGPESQPVLEEYFTFLYEKDYVFFCDEVTLTYFPDIDLKWESPNQIENAIIDVSKNSNHPYLNIFDQLNDLGCNALQMRFFDPIEFATLDKILGLLQKNRIETVELIIHFTTDLNVQRISQLLENHLRVDQVIIHSCPEDRTLENFSNHLGQVTWIQQAISSSAHCGFITPHSFSININHFTESQQHNSCLNKKISIDENGAIKNCPASTKYFGHIQKDTLKDALLQDAFQAAWQIHKDQIKVCQDCEFRYVCSDCRTFLEQPDDQYSKPSRCNYDPYSASWHS